MAFLVTSNEVVSSSHYLNPAISVYEAAYFLVPDRGIMEIFFFFDELEQFLLQTTDLMRGSWLLLTRSLGSSDWAPYFLLYTHWNCPVLISTIILFFSSFLKFDIILSFHELATSPADTWVYAEPSSWRSLSLSLLVISLWPSLASFLHALINIVFAWSFFLNSVFLSSLSNFIYLIFLSHFCTVASILISSLKISFHIFLSISFFKLF